MGRRVSRARFIRVFIRVMICLSIGVFGLPLVWHTPPKTHDADPRVLMHRQQEETEYRRMHMKSRLNNDSRVHEGRRVREKWRALGLGEVNPSVRDVASIDSADDAAGAGRGAEVAGGGQQEGEGAVSGQPPVQDDSVEDDSDAAGGADSQRQRADDAEGDEKAGRDPSVVRGLSHLDSKYPEVSFLKSAPYQSITERIAATTPQDQWGPPATDADALYEATNCDIYTVPFNPKRDSPCLKSLKDISRWRSLEALPQKFDERTIKFKVTIGDEERDPNSPVVKAILKVPQRLYPGEPYGETAAYHADRVFGINRIPPTTLACVPLDWLVVAALRTGREMKLVKDFAADSGVEDYAGWLKKDFIDFTTRDAAVSESFERSGGSHFSARMDLGELERFLRTHGGKAVRDEAAKERQSGALRGTPEGLCVHASVQLFVAEAGRFLDSIYAIPYRAHDPSWHKYFAPAAKYYPPTDTDYNVSLLHISEIVTFDFIVGNADRSPNKNNFVVGGCRVRCPKGPKHPGPPDFVHLDNGLVFRSAPDNPISKKGAHDPGDPSWSSFCWFYAPFIVKLRKIQDSGVDFEHRMEAVMSKAVGEHIGNRRLSAASGRVAELLSQVDHCVDRWGVETVMHV